MRFIQGIIAVLLGVLTLPVAASGDPDPLFMEHSTLQVELTAPLSILLRERPEVEYLPGDFVMKTADGSAVELDAGVRARGNFRYRNCDFPPLLLNFRRSQLEGTLLDGQNKLKLVTHCKITRRYEQTLLREYLAYRMLNVLTDQSFRVRLLQITYVDNEARRPRMVRSAFMVEDEDRLAARIGRERQEIERAEINTLRPDHLNLTSLFQYLIGNVDFSPVLGSSNECCHNYALFGSEAGSRLAIPYDFDLAGIVNAPYAEPDRERGVERIGQRSYQGHCVNNDQVGNSIARFMEVREALYDLVAGLEALETDVRENIARYVDEFYETINDPLMVEREIVGKCI